MSGHAVCTAHNGRHGVYEGRCVLMGAEVPRPFTFRPGGRCGTCGVELDLRYERGKRSAVTLLAGTDTPHGHSTLSVDLDADTLAEAIVRASRTARQERQPQPQQGAVAAAPVQQANHPVRQPVPDAIPAVAVWTPSDGVGGG